MINALSKYYCDDCVICTIQRWIEEHPTGFIIGFTIAIVTLVAIAIWINNNITH